MAEYALLINTEFKEIRNYESKPQNIPHKNVKWYEVIREKGSTEFTGLKNGNWVIRTIDPSTLPPSVPYSITPKQVRLLLLQQNLLANVEAMIAQQDEATKITWQYDSEFRRNDPLLDQLALELDLTEQQIDEFFIAASKL